MNERSGSVRRSTALTLLGFCALIVVPSAGADDAPDRVSAASFTDKVTAGYQAWFSCPDAGADNWFHWNTNRIPAPGDVSFELYPDVREYDDEALCETALGPLADGTPSRLFDSAAPSVIDTHFRWMREYGIDGVGLQRFAAGLYDPERRGYASDERSRTIVARVRAAAERHGRVFYVMYDTSGGRRTEADGSSDGYDDWAEVIKRDWEETMLGALDVTSSEQYARQDGRPVVNLWGMGFPDRPARPDEAEALVRWFQARGVYVAGGVPYQWRDGRTVANALDEPPQVLPGMAATYAALDLVQPWAVGTVRAAGDVPGQFATGVAADLALTRSRGQDYQRVIFPGFAWSNWFGRNDPDIRPQTPNDFPREAGELFWAQAFGTASAGTGAYLAMFDEYDESTAIAKAAEDADMTPSDQYFLTLDADGVRLSSDFYLRLAGAAVEMIAGRAPSVDDVPVPAHVVRLDPGDSLRPDDTLVSDDGRFRLIYQRDGNLVLYDDVALAPAWAAETEGTTPGVASMQRDGNLVVYDADGRVRWSSDTAGNAGSALELDDGGALAVRARGGSVTWRAPAD